MRHSVFSILVAAFAVMAPAARAQSYGPEEQLLTIGAAEFRPMSPGAGYIDSSGYLFSFGTFADAEFLAPLSLPEGASIERLCLYSFDSGPDFVDHVDVSLVVGKLTPDGETPDVESVGFGVSSSPDAHYEYSCSESFSYTLRRTTDVDGDGNLDAAVYYVHAEIPGTDSFEFALGGVQITWKRQVSLPPATPTFGDVPTSDPAFPYVEALAASGITAGCSGGNYCPEANLTRRQMAVFLAKALGLHWSD